MDDSEVFCPFSENSNPEKFYCTFLLEKLERLFLLKEFEPSPDRIASHFRLNDILVKTRSRMTTAVTFSRQNDVGSRLALLAIDKTSSL